MEQPSSYCSYVQSLEPGHVHVHYHNHHYGFPIADDDQLFGRLILKINQAGLSWTTILRKQQSFEAAYGSFSIKKIAQYGQ